MFEFRMDRAAQSNVNVPEKVPPSLKIPFTAEVIGAAAAGVAAKSAAKMKVSRRDRHIVCPFV